LRWTQIEAICAERCTFSRGPFVVGENVASLPIRENPRNSPAFSRRNLSQAEIDARAAVRYHPRVVRLRWLLVFTLAFAACTDRRERAERVLREDGAGRLRADAARLYKEAYGGRGAEFSVLAESAWPPSFRRFKPRRVGAYADGFTLALETEADTERGLFVIPQGFTLDTPRWGSGAEFEPLAEGIFWYAFAVSGRGRD
jgi:hypothetical protein